MDDADLALRNLTYRRFVEAGRAPTSDELAVTTAQSVDDVVAGWRRLHESHALVLRPGTNELWMANPFSAVPTAHRVLAGGRWWYANCAWDAFGVCAALGVDGRVASTCPDCAAALVVEVSDHRPSVDDLVFHCLVPAERWWDDIGFT